MGSRAVTRVLLVTGARSLADSTDAEAWARDVVEQIPMYLGATWWGQQLRAAMCEEAIRGRSE